MCNMSYYVENIKFDRRALSQVYGIICDYDEEDYEKIPKNIRAAIEDNRAIDYDFTIDDVEENNSNLMDDTKKILAYLYTNFLSTPEEKEVLKKLEYVQYQNSRAKYNINFPNANIKDNEEDKTNSKENLSLVEYKESFLTKIFNKIKNLFTINK